MVLSSCMLTTPQFRRNEFIHLVENRGSIKIQGLPQRSRKAIKRNSLTVPLNPLRLHPSVRCTLAKSFLSRLHFANTLALIPFPRGLVHSMVRAYFGAKKTASVRTDQLLTTASAPSGHGCSGPSYEAYTRTLRRRSAWDPRRMLARSKEKTFTFSDIECFQHRVDQVPLYLL